MAENITDVIDEPEIRTALDAARGEADRGRIAGIIEEARQGAGLTLEDAARLLSTGDEELTGMMLDAAGEVRKNIYGERLVLFAPLYLSNYCVNDCEYCGFHSRNPAGRTRLTIDEITAEAKALINMGHKRLLLECGEDPEKSPVDYVVKAMEAVYSAKAGNGGIRRVNVNMAPPGVAGMRKLKKTGIGTYQLFQETYERGAYARFHRGPKADYARQLFAHDRAFEAGIDDVGLGVLFGLCDHRFETLGLLSHARYLERRFNVGPHTVSVPRLRPASTVAMRPPHPVGDAGLLKVIAVLRLALPYTGIILSTRERREFREKAFTAGVTQASAGSVTAPGGYGRESAPGGEGAAQFSLGDERSLEAFLRDTIGRELVPSFCTACYRRGRTGKAFMELARPGDIRNFCSPNALLTFKEYLEDYAPADVRESGLEIIERRLLEIGDGLLREETKRRMERIEAGARDLFF